MEEILTEELKQEILKIVKKASGNGTMLTEREVVLLFYWKHHENEPEFAFVPEEYRGYR